jgi:hypothetical protein
MSNGFIYVVDAHFIDKIEKKKSWTEVPVGKMVRDSRGKKMHAMRGSKDLYSRILGGIGKGSEGQTQLQYF